MLKCSDLNGHIPQSQHKIHVSRSMHKGRIIARDIWISEQEICQLQECDLIRKGEHGYSAPTKISTSVCILDSFII